MESAITVGLKYKAPGAGAYYSTVVRLPWEIIANFVKG